MSERKPLQHSLLILGTRGVPAEHGGFETFAEKLSLHLSEVGWTATVYCQKHFDRWRIQWATDVWHGVRRVNIATPFSGAIGTALFDVLSVLHAVRAGGVALVLGYNTAILIPVLRIFGLVVATNMDGIEWKRSKWSLPFKLWFYLNEWIGVHCSSRLIADHPAIANHLRLRKGGSDIVTIAYGAEKVRDASAEHVLSMGLTPGSYFLSVGRIEPENSILEMISAYVGRGDFVTPFVCVGALNPKTNKYHAAVLDAAAGRVHFPGAIYDKVRLQALRFHALAYCHGHTVGGTNPSLVEALGSRSAVIAHDNEFNRWVAGDGQLYFRDISSCVGAMNRAAADPAWLQLAKAEAYARFEAEFTWKKILSEYETFLEELSFQI